jgi:hypothetical protein
MLSATQAGRETVAKVSKQLVSALRALLSIMVGSSVAQRKTGSPRPTTVVTGPTFV